MDCAEALLFIDVLWVWRFGRKKKALLFLHFVVFAAMLWYHFR